MIVTPIKTRIFKENEDLIDFIRKHVPKLPERSILAVTSKIVALSEGRTAALGSEREKVALIKRESQWAMKTKYVWLTIRDGVVMASAGIDESNGSGKYILLPKDSFKSAMSLRRRLQKIYRVKKLGVVITDSRLMPLRAGIVGVALGIAGFKGIKDYRKEKDIFGRPFHFSKTDIADSIATAAVLTMGEGDERCPLALIENAPVEFADRVSKDELRVDIAEDIYRPLFAKIKHSNILQNVRMFWKPGRTKN
jgi:dihydrofolate synthase / folylpolyglutamate synthase